MRMRSARQNNQETNHEIIMKLYCRTSTKSGVIKWSFWRRTAKRFIPVESTCLTVSIPPTGPRLRALNVAEFNTQ